MVLLYINMNLQQVYTCSPSWTLLPPPSPYHPSGSSQCTSPKHPVSCIEPGLVTRFIYDIIHVSMPFSQIIPPSPSPTESKRLFYKHQFSSLCHLNFLLQRISLFCMFNCFFPIYESIFPLLCSSHHICSFHPLQSGFHFYIPLKYSGKDVKWSFSDYIQGALSSLTTSAVWSVSICGPFSAPAISLYGSSEHAKRLRRHLCFIIYVYYPSSAFYFNLGNFHLVLTLCFPPFRVVYFL